MIFPRLIAVLVSAASLSRAQIVSSPPKHLHTPPASPHGGPVVVLDQFVTSASPLPRNQADLAQSTTVLAGESLRLKRETALGETLAGEIGLHATSYGPGASRPIVRGLGGDRIRLLENGVGTGDASVVSPDHAVSVEPFLVERIEIVRGPASLLYGSNAVGGVVNVFTHRIETDLPNAPVRGVAELRGGTAADEIAGGGVVNFAVTTGAGRALVIHADGFRREAKNLRIPAFAESATVRAEHAEEAAARDEPPPVFARERLPNSAQRSRSGAIGASYVTPSFHFGFSHSGIDSNYGTPGHAHEAASTGVAEGVRIDLRQRRLDGQGEWHRAEGLIESVRFKYGQADYRHHELEPDGAVATVFTNRAYEGRIELLHRALNSWTGALGVHATRNDLHASGEEAFLPTSRTNSTAVFAFEEVVLGRLTAQFGARHERTALAAGARSKRRDDELAASMGALWKMDDEHTLAVSVARTGRAPNAQELFAEGPHAGTRSYEIGNAALGAERSLGLEASLRRREGMITGVMTVYIHRFRGYIFEEPTGVMAIGGGSGWEFIPSAGAEGDTDAEALPVYRYVQRDARFWGAELEAIWHVHDGRRGMLDFRLAADFTRARESRRNLPRIPAARAIGGVTWAAGPWSAGAECQVVFRQNRLAASERPSAGYILVSAHVTRTVPLGSAQLEWFLRGSNLANAEARSHTSFVRDFAPLAARAATAGMRIAF